MEMEVRHRVAMAQMMQPTTVDPPTEFPELPLPYVDQETYLQDFRSLEHKIIHDMANTSKDESTR